MSSKFARLYPNTRVKLIVEKHKWLYVEWTDYLEAIPRYGWVNKKYLKKTQSHETLKKDKTVGNLKEKEIGLIKKVKESVISDEENRLFYELIEKRRDENISNDELEELIELTDKSEELNVKRLKYLLEIAQIRNKSLREVMRELEIFPPQTI